MVNKVSLKSDSYIQIAGWMINELDLKGNELMIYALIHGFSQDGRSYFRGSLQYIALWTNSTKQGVIKTIKSLIEKGLIVKELCNRTDGTSEMHYWTTKSRGISSKVQEQTAHTAEIDTRSTEFTTIQKGSELSLPPTPTRSTEFTTPGKLSLPPRSTEFTTPGKLSLPNILDILDNTTASTARDINKTTEKAEEAEIIKNKLKELFEGNYIFDNGFIPQILQLSKDFDLSSQQIAEYLQFVFDKAVEKKPSSLTNMFYKMAKAANLFQDFKIAIKRPDEVFINCPVCGAKHNRNVDCPECGIEYVNLANPEKLVWHKRYFDLSEAQKDEYQNRVNILENSDKELPEKMQIFRQLQKEFKLIN